MISVKYNKWYNLESQLINFFILIIKSSTLISHEKKYAGQLFNGTLDIEF